MFNTKSQPKKMEYYLHNIKNDNDAGVGNQGFGLPPSLDMQSLTQLANEKGWLDDNQIRIRQTFFDDYCLDDSTKAICLTNKPMLHSAMTQDAVQLNTIKKIQEAYAQEEQIKEQIFQLPVQINSIDQFKMRIDEFQDCQRSFIQPQMADIKSRISQ